MKGRQLNCNNDYFLGRTDRDNGTRNESISNKRKEA